MNADLHIHSIFSDSSRSPEEIVQIAREKGVGMVSICDHYTIDSYDPLVASCHNTGIQAILGVELDANWNDENFHVLAYNFDRDNEDIKDYINSQYNKSQTECEQIIMRMSKDYPQMSLEDYLNYNYPFEKGGWKYIHYAVHTEAAATYEEAANFFGTYFKPDPRTFELSDFCNIVRKAGGIPVLAHPGYLHKRNPDTFNNILKGILAHGILGIECFYPSHSKAATEICLDFCKKNELRITGGCDCHGYYDKSEGFTIGGIEISTDMLDLRGIAE